MTLWNWTDGGKVASSWLISLYGDIGGGDERGEK